MKKGFVGQLAVIIKHYDGRRERIIAWDTELPEIERKAFQVPAGEVPAKEVYSFDDFYNYTGGDRPCARIKLHSSKFTYKTAEGKYKLVDEMRPLDDFVEL